jgi:FXSXX-COOH protein
VKNAELTELSELVQEVSSLDDTVLGHAIRRVHRETEEGRDPVAAFGAFNQHSSSPW